MSSTTCETTNRLSGLTFRAYLTREPSISCVSAELAPESVNHVFARIGADSTISWSDSMCTFPTQREYLIKAAHRPKVGATERLVGSLGDVFPELKELSERDIERHIREMRR